MDTVDKNNIQGRIDLDKYYLETWKKPNFQHLLGTMAIGIIHASCDDIFELLQRDILKWTTPNFISA